MSAPLQLPAKLDLPASLQLVGDLREIDGDMHIDASNVTHMGALCLQALIAAARKAKGAGSKFEITGISEKVAAQLAAMGTSPEHLAEGAQ